MTYPSFSTGELLSSADMNRVGLWLIKSENSVTATNASPYGVQSVFTSDFRNYRLVWYASQASATCALQIQWFTGTNTPTTTGVYGYGWYGNWATATPTYQFASYAQTNPFAPATTLWLGADIAATYSAHGWLDIQSPQVANVSTRYMGQTLSAYTGGNYNTALTGIGGTETATQYTGFRFIPSAGTSTITYRLYGYRD